ncbi:hypothetical protein GCM10023322_32640 [Rugosimonospora acidiphila]|uniref:Uncharacterized protein n=1 Tax=Rugosimonospora acidiphila TaxID=556531 RepID=A0ABP9RUZ0_9ACTN
MSASSRGAVEDYLDALFDRLAGSGGHGRRVLAEAEDHLLQTVDEAMAQGIGRDTAEREAVARFGEARQLAATVQAARTRMVTVTRRLVTFAWLLAGVTALTYGLSGVLTWIIGFLYERLLAANNYFGTLHHPWYLDPSGAKVTIPYCSSQPNSTIGCLPIGHDTLTYLGQDLRIGMFVGATVVGLVLLTSLAIARRYTLIGLPAWTPPRLSLTTALITFSVLAAAAPLYIGTYSVITRDLQGDVLADLITTVLCVAIGVSAWRLRRPRGTW